MHARFITRHPFVVLAVLAAITAIQGYYALQLGVDFTLEGLFLTEAPELVTYRSFRKSFGPDDDQVFLLFKVDELFAPAPLAALDRLTGKLEQLAGVRRVLSLARFKGLAGPLAGTFGGDTVAKVAASPAGLARFKEWALSNRMLVKGLVSKDGRTACVVLEGDLPTQDRPARVRRLLDAVETELAAERSATGYAYYVAGIPTIEAEYVRFIREDTRTFIPLVVGIFFLLCTLYFGSLRAALLIVATVGTAVVWLLGVMVQAGRPMGVLSSLLPNMILVIGVGDSLFILLEYVHQLTPGRTPREAAENTIRIMTLPCFLTSITSAIGFSTLCTTDIGMVREFGWLAALGLMLAYVVSLTLPASLLCAFGLRFRPPDEGFLSRRIVRLVAWVGRVNRERRRGIVLAVAAAVFVSAWGATKVRVESSWFQDLKKDSSVTRAHAFAQDHFAGLFTLEARVTPGQGGVLEPRFLAGLAEVQEAVEADLSVSHSTSPADVVREVLRSASGRVSGPDPIATLVAGQAATALQLARAFGAGGIIDQYVGKDARSARLSVRLGRTTSSGLFRLMGVIEHETARCLPDARLEFTGKNVLGARALQQMIDNMTQSLGLAMVLIFGCMGVMLRSLRMGLLSMIPNLIPMLTTFGFMGATGISVSFSTMTIFSISLGVAVDNTIHFLSKYKQLQAEGADPEAASARTLATIGNGMVLSGIILVLGFATIMTSNFGFTANFGLLGLVTMVVAVLADLHITPLLALLCPPKRAPAGAVLASGDGGGSAAGGAGGEPAGAEASGTPAAPGVVPGSEACG
ncbi:MAG: MMPL family transporter [Planctomycetes bacterium]|nr:MMPL family transporter [Planctomycetota bacterium]